MIQYILMKISVIIPAFNEEKQLGACLQSIIDQEEKADEIIVVDNNSSDHTAEIAQNYGVGVIKEYKQGMIYARNCGFNEAKYEIIARTDADTYVPKDWIRRIKVHFKEDKKLVGLSGAAYFRDIPSLAQISQWPTRVFFVPFRRIIGHDCLYGPNMVIRKSAWEKIKNDVCLNEHQVHEDMDLAVHIGEFGHVKFDSKLVVSTSFRRWKKLSPYFEYSYRNMWTIQRHKEVIRQRGKRFVERVLSKRSNLQATLMNKLQGKPVKV